MKIDAAATNVPVTASQSQQVPRAALNQFIAEISGGWAAFDSAFGPDDPYKGQRRGSAPHG